MSNTYGTKVFMVQGGDAMAVKAGGKIQKCSSSGVLSQAAAIAAITATGTFSTGIAAKIEAMRAALTNVGILATG
ncbi:MAG TPA: hypothetical protein VJ797_15565 [Burkholderiales bacterium]|nr:hypothetical protein [Burkholderiales bacterium]